MTPSLKKLKAYLDAVETLQRLGAVAVPIVSASLAVFVGSRTVAILIAVAAAVAAVFGVFFTSATYQGDSKQVCFTVRRKYLIRSAVSAGVVLLAFVISDPDVAVMVGFIAPIREFLLTAMLLFDVTVAIGAFLSVYFLVGSIVLSSPSLWLA